jgi:hypothetical protein
MTEQELWLFEQLLACSGKYLEFGSGGSTCLAAATVSTSVIAVDSSKLWLDKVAEWCSANGCRVTPELVHADIGEIGKWGWPHDPDSRHRWPSYHGGVWENPAASDADLYLIDGRFRVACFMQVIVHANPDSIIAFHDFAS